MILSRVGYYICCHFSFLESLYMRGSQDNLKHALSLSPSDNVQWVPLVCFAELFIGCLVCDLCELIFDCIHQMLSIGFSHRVTLPHPPHLFTGSQSTYHHRAE